MTEQQSEKYCQQLFGHDDRATDYTEFMDYGTFTRFGRFRSSATMRQIGIIIQCVLLATVPVWGQTKPAGAGKSSLCTRDNALDMVKQQVDLTKTFDDPVRRIAVLIRAGGVLWPYQQDKARAVFTEAFELATENEKGQTQRQTQSILLRMKVPDLRYDVITAVAKRDPAWARDLIRQLPKPDRNASQNSFTDVLTGARLLNSANKIIGTELNAALDLANASLNYPANFELTRFLYRLAEVNQQGADQFYARALAVYRDKPLREFLYLQAYPFAWRETLNTPVFTFHDQIPPRFVPNQTLQRRFVEAMLRRAQLALEAPLEQADTYRDPTGAWIPGTIHILHGLIRLEPQVQTSIPDLLPSLIEAREKILVSLSVESQRRFVQPGQEAALARKETFDEQIERAEKEPDVDERDQMFANAVLGAASGKATLESVVETIDKISDSTLRSLLLESVYFQRAKAAINEKQLEEARTLASHVEGHEQRAFLFTEIAKAYLKTSQTQTLGRELLDDAITEAKKAGVTIFAARTLLTASNLYVKIDLNRSIALLADAVSCVNRLEAPDFASDDQALEKTPQRRVRGGRYGGEYMLRYYMPGLDPESAFREIGKIDFDTALAQSSALTDKFQRALATVALAEVCLDQLPPPQKDRGASHKVRPR